MRTYLVIVDETKEASVALRFAARRALRTGGALHILALAEKEAFSAWGGVQATLQEEARNRAEALVVGAAGDLSVELGLRPSITVKQGDPVKKVREMIAELDGVAALVLGAAAHGAPGPLVSHFTGHEAGSMPCPVMIIPGGLSKEAIDALS